MALLPTRFGASTRLAVAFRIPCRWSTSPIPNFGTRSRSRYRKRVGSRGSCGVRCFPYAQDAWYVPTSVKIGYEISFNRYFYKPEPMRTLEGDTGGYSGGREGDGRVAL